MFPPLQNPRCSTAHQGAAGIVRRHRESSGAMPFADDLNLEATFGRGHGTRHVAERQGRTDAVAEGPRGHPTHDFALVPNGFVADRVRIRGIDLEADEAQRSAAVLLFGCRRASDKVALLEIHESAEARLERPIDGAVLPGPRA